MTMEMRSRVCPVCGGSDAHLFADTNVDWASLGQYAFASRKLPEYMHHRLSECTRCDSLYASPVPTTETLQRAYHDASFDSAEEASFASVAYGEFLPAIARRLERLEGALDIGTGDGAFLEQLQKCGFRQIVGVEPSRAPVQQAKAHLRPLIRQTPFRAEDFAPGSLSLITCFQTLEHVDDPAQLCRQAHELLRPGGALFVVSHNRRALPMRVLGKRSPIFDVEHLQLFSPKSLTHLLTQAGFEHVDLRPVRNRYPLKYWFKLLPVPVALKARVLARLQSSRLGGMPVSLAAGNFAAIAYKAKRASDPVTGAKRAWASSLTASA